ncbi:RrF2 family transcriptional regulator [Aliirhizobium smilacinae]|nr:Rrf2 family transcriptional regulator [Rhizobium smilacinae]
MEDKWMRLKRETEVAIAILVACAQSNECRLKTADAAKGAETTPDFAAHIVLRLVNAGLVKAKRVRNGGLELLRPAKAISLRDIICWVEDLAPAGPKGIGGRVKDRGLEQIIHGANHAVEAYLDRFSIADLVDIKRTSEMDEFRESTGIKPGRRPNRREHDVASEPQSA